MKLSAVVLAVAAAAMLAFATPGRAATPPTLRVVMHDPGCHWFAVAGKFTTHDTVSSPVRVLNLDINTLKATSGGTVQRIPIGHSLVLGPGRYVITMVGQAPDDNHLKLTVA